MASRGDIKFEEVQPKLSEKWLKLGFEETLDKTGSFTKLKSKEYFDEGEFPVIDQGDSFISGYINDEELLYQGELPVIIFGDHTRIVKFIDFPFATGADGTKVLKPYGAFDSMFYFYYLKSLKIPSLGYSRHFKILKAVKVPLPPLAEQQRIVTKLDELFKHVDTLKTRLNHIPLLLKNFRQAVLTQAVTGKLTEQWRVGKELEEWENKKINDVVESLNQGWSPKCESFPSTSDEIWGVIKTSSVQPLKFVEEENKQLPIHLEPREQHELIAGDLLITRAGPRVRVGIASLVKEVRPKLMICDKVYRLRVNKRITSSEFLEIVLNSFQILAVIEIMKTGISDSGLNLTQTKFKSIEFNNPPKQEQTEIVKRVAHLFAKADAIEAQYQALKTKTDSLPQAILAKAFKGELVAQLPTDGDAKVLLEEIVKLKASLQGTKQSVKRRKK